MVVSSYSLHHIPDPARVIREMSRVVKQGGRVGVVDIRAPENSKVAEAADRIERVRDHSHTRGIPLSEFEKLFRESDLRIIATEPLEDSRAFDDWMHVAGWRPEDPAYMETRRLMEVTIEDDSAGFHPRLVPVPAAENYAADSSFLEIVHTNVLIAAEKM